MFRCQYNGQISQPGQRPVVLVTSREKEYKNEFGDVISKGWEIVKEYRVLPQNVETAKKKWGIS
mgnify:CR=1 FL=1